MSSETALQAALAELAAIRTDMVAAVDAIQAGCEAGLSAGDPAAIAQHFCAILEATAFQDITGQRLNRVEQILCAAGLQARVEPQPARLENGPALPGQGLSQAGADALLGPVTG